MVQESEFKFFPLFNFLPLSLSAQTLRVDHWFSARDDFALQRQFGHVWRHIWSSQLGDSYRPLESKSQGCCSTSTVHRTAIHHKELPAQNVIVAKVEKPWNRLLEPFSVSFPFSVPFFPSLRPLSLM